VEDDGRQTVHAAPGEPVDARVERLARELGEAIRTVETEGRRVELRDYAAELLREETAGAPAAATTPAAPRAMGPLALAALLALVGGVLLLVVTPIGIVFLLLAGIAGLWGLATSDTRRLEP
jgi:hypothetical protein